MRRALFAAPLAALLAAALVAPAAQAEPTSKFSVMFPQLAGFTTPTDQQIADLAQTMLDPNADSENNPDALSVFTYFGQFVDHDLTLDTTPPPLGKVNPQSLKNSRTMRFDLDSVYGDGPTGTPQLYETDGQHFKVQNPNPNGVKDLPRNANGSAILAEGRNDENQIISQIHLAFLLTHNKFVDSGMSYKDARLRTIRLYQHIVLNEFLPHIVGQATLDGTRNGSIERFYKPANPNANKTPVEFSVAAYRFGHSMVRRAYRLQPGPGGAAGPNIQVFSLTAADLRGGRQLTADRAIDWGNFVPELSRADNAASVNLSRKIDPLISSSLFVLPIPGAAATGSNVLSFRNMQRADAYGMASGQDVAEAMGEPVMTPEELNLGPGFETGTPLWFYILTESSERADGVTLGPVGGRIVADVMVRLLEGDPDSIISKPATDVPSSFADLFVGAGLAQRP